MDGVQPALEERPEDGRVHGAPVQAGGLHEDLHLRLFQEERGARLEEVAVEAAHRVHAEVAARGHGLEELGDGLSEALGFVLGLVQEAREEVVLEEADVLGEHAEDEAVQEVGHLLGVLAALAQALGDLADVPGGLGRDGLARDAGLELLGIVEDGAEDFEVARPSHLLQRDGVDHRGRAREVGVDLQDVHVADHEEGRVLQGLAVAQELGVGLVQVGVALFVLPAEEAPLPHVGPARPPPSLATPFSKVKASPVLSISTGVGWPTRAHRSRKCSWHAERSVSWTSFHLRMNSEGVMGIIVAWTARGKKKNNFTTEARRTRRKQRERSEKSKVKSERKDTFNRKGRKGRKG